jgi:hypothetical protein
MKSFLVKLFNKDSENLKTLNSFEHNDYFKPIIEKTKKINLPQITEYVCKLLNQVKSKNIKMKKFKDLVNQGIPDELASLRSLVWKLIVGYLPSNVEQWDSVLQKYRLEYKAIQKEFYRKLKQNEKICQEELDKHMSIKKEKDRNKSVDFSSTTLIDDVDISLAKHSSVVFTKVSVIDDTYNLSKTKVSQNLEALQMMSKDENITGENKKAILDYIQDCEILDEINKDIRRTRSNMHFLFLPSKQTPNYTNENIANIAHIIRNDGYMDDEANSNFNYETNIDVLARILFVYAKKNSRISYVQGMNELLIPFYYCFFNDSSSKFINFIESDTFFCFELFMSKIDEIYEKKTKLQENGMHIRLSKLKEYLKILDEDLFNLFKKEKVELELFCFRWYALFLTQELELPDVLRLWDTVLSEENYFDYMNCLCIAILKIKKNEIVNLKFCDIILNLKKLNIIDIEFLLKETAEIKKKYIKIK